MHLDFGSCYVCVGNQRFNLHVYDPDHGETLYDSEIMISGLTRINLQAIQGPPLYSYRYPNYLFNFGVSARGPNQEISDKG
jgi:hypothetical protein